MGEFKDFAFFVLDPNNPSSETNIQGEVENYIVANLIVDDVKKNDRVWLSGTLRVDNNADFLDVRVQIFRGIPSTGGVEIFRTDLELGPEDGTEPGNPNGVLQIPVAHVDVITKEVLEELNDDDVLYILALTVESGVEVGGGGTVDFDITGPITFTAVRIKH